MHDCSFNINNICVKKKKNREKNSITLEDGL